MAANATYDDCACGDACRWREFNFHLKNKADSQHQCPWCDQNIHTFCGVETTTLPPRKSASLKTKRTCTKCKPRMEAAASGASTAAGRPRSGDTQLIGSARPTAEEARISAQRRKAIYSQRKRDEEREREGIDDRFANAFGASAQPESHRRSSAPTGVAVAAAQQQRQSQQESQQLAMMPMIPIGQNSRIGGLANPSRSLFSHCGVQGPSVQVIGNAFQSQRQDHENRRPKRTSQTYSPFFQKSWKPFCDSKDGDILEGVLIEGKGSDEWDYLVTPDKAYLFMQLFGLKRKKRRGGGGPRQKKSCENDLCSIVDLFNYQRCQPEHMATMANIPHPRVKNAQLQELMDNYAYDEKDRRDRRSAEQSGSALCDGEYYTRRQHKQASKC